MLLKTVSLVSILTLTLIAVGCSNVAPTYTPASTPNIGNFDTLSNSGGDVTMDVRLLDFQINQPLVFDVVMNTHSVDLSNDMVKISILRDDTGKEYKPTAWEGAGPGGHHREGKLQFAAMTTKPKYVELVIKDLAQIAARSFRWELR